MCFSFNIGCYSIQLDILLRTGDGFFLLNRQNLLGMMKFICRWSFTIPSGIRDAIFFLRAHSAAHSSKRFKPFFDTILLWQGLCWIGKKHKQGIWLCLWCLIWPSSTLRFLFPFALNCLWAIFSLNLEDFCFYIWVVVVWLLISQRRLLYITSCFYPCPWLKNLSATTTKYIPKCWEKSVKMNSSLSFIRVIKNSSFNQHFLYAYHMVLKPF